MPATSGLALVHLVRGANGPAPFAAFADSYRAHAAGSAHELVLIMKGFDSAAQRAEHLRAASDLPHRTLDMSDEGSDLDAYAAAARRLEHERFCFVNSFSVILADDWLGHLDRAADREGVGMVGATGSWASPRSLSMHDRRLPSPYRPIFTDRSWMRREFRALALERSGSSAPRFARARWEIQSSISAVDVVLSHLPFPAPHLRTNAFMLDAEILRGLKLGSTRRKRRAYQAESGRHGLTRQVMSRGLSVLVVDRHGAVYEPESWDRSATFWQRGQEALMVADNQTLVYARADADRRWLLSSYAWGERARPTIAG